MNSDIIYALVDPRDDSIRYIGKTNSLKSRLSQHLKDKSNLNKYNWVQELKSLSLIPLMTTLYVCKDNDNGGEIERTIICKHIKLGAKLFNIFKKVEGITIYLIGNEIRSLGIMTDELADRLINYINANRDSY